MGQHVSMLLARWKRAGRGLLRTGSRRRPSYRSSASLGSKLAFARLIWHAHSASLRHSSATTSPEHAGWTCLSCARCVRFSVYPSSTSFGNSRSFSSSLGVRHSWEIRWVTPAYRGPRGQNLGLLTIEQGVNLPRRRPRDGLG